VEHTAWFEHIHKKTSGGKTFFPGVAWEGWCGRGRMCPGTPSLPCNLNLVFFIRGGEPCGMYHEPAFWRTFHETSLHCGCLRPHTQASKKIPPVTNNRHRRGFLIYTQRGELSYILYTTNVYRTRSIHHDTLLYSTIS
jgi:hypothetical protein